MSSLTEIKKAINSSSLRAVKESLQDAIELIETLREDQAKSHKPDVSAPQSGNGNRQLNQLRQALNAKNLPEAKNALNEAIEMIEALKEENAAKLAKKAQDKKETDRNKLKEQAPSFIDTVINVLKWTTIAFLSSLVVALVIGLSWQATLLLPGAVIAGFAVNETLKYVSRQQYEAYRSKTPSDLEALSNTQRKAFHLGASAANSNQVRITNLFMWQAYCSPKAYYAGLEAGIKNNEALLNNVATKKKPSL